METDGAALGLTLAFNTLGWEAQNLLFAAVDALVGSNIGTAQPSHVLAHISNSDIAAAGSVTVQAQSEAYIHSNILNQTESVLAAAGGSKAKANASGSSSSSSASSGSSASAGAGQSKSSGLSAGFVLASNMVNSAARSWIDGTGRSVSTLDGGLSVDASDQASIASKVDLSAVSSAGDESKASLAMKAVLNYFALNFTDRSGEQDLQTGDRVRLADATYSQLDQPKELANGERVLLSTSVGGGSPGAAPDRCRV
jgi:hypothetical protein